MNELWASSLCPELMYLCSSLLLPKAGHNYNEPDLRKAVETGTLATNLFLALIWYLSQYPLEANFILLYSIFNSCEAFFLLRKTVRFYFLLLENTTFLHHYIIMEK